MRQPGEILPDDVEFQIDFTANLEAVEVCMLKRIGNDGDLECIVRRVADGQRNAVDCYRAFVDGHVSALSHRLVERVLEREIPAPLSVLNVDAFRRHVDVSLNDVSVQPTVNRHAALYVDLVADL